MSETRQSVGAMRLEHHVKEFVKTFQKEVSRLSVEEEVIFMPVAMGALETLEAMQKAGWIRLVEECDSEIENGHEDVD